MTQASKKIAEQANLLQLLRTILPKAAPEHSDEICSACESELRRLNQAAQFTRFCELIELPNLNAESVEAVRQQFESAFSDSASKSEIKIAPAEESGGLNVEVELPDGLWLRGHIPITAAAVEEVVLKFVAFPVSQPGDEQLVWLLAKREDLSNEDAARALSKCESDFWESRMGQKCLRDRVDRRFSEFIARVPTAMLRDSGIKRHYKQPEVVKVLRKEMV